MIEREALPEWIKIPSSMYAGYFYWQNKATGACVWEDPQPEGPPYRTTTGISCVNFSFGGLNFS